MFPKGGADTHPGNSVHWTETQITASETSRQVLDRSRHGIKSGLMVLSSDKPKQCVEFVLFKWPLLFLSDLNSRCPRARGTKTLQL